MMRSSIGALFMIVAAASQAVDERTVLYEVNGSSPRMLRESLDRSRPVADDGRRHDALTKWDVSWQYKAKRSHRGCEIVSLDVSVDIVVTIPRWVNEAEANSSLRRRWNAYIAALLLHEDGHKAVAKDALAAIRRGGREIGPKPTCEEVGEDVNQMGLRLVEEYGAKDRQYDVETDHGRTQGARFP